MTPGCLLVGRRLMATHVLTRVTLGNVFSLAAKSSENDPPVGWHGIARHLGASWSILVDLHAKFQASWRTS